MVGTLQRRKRVLWNQIEYEHGVFIDILSRLPAQSIRSFQTINKYWLGSVRNKFFAKKQLNRSRENPGFIACRIKDSALKLYSTKPESFKLSYVNRINPSERSDEAYMHMISSFNGLICCINQIGVENKLHDLQIWICNPCTGETLLLPQGTPSYDFVPSVGVAYYSDISEYKVFRIFCAGKKCLVERVFDRFDTREDGQMVRKYRYVLAYECEVYSSTTSSWENIGPVPCLSMDSYCSPFGSGHVFIGGKVYWISSLDDPGEILSVDLSGRFEVLPLPQYPDGLREEDAITEASHLVNLNGALSMVILHPGYMDIWVWNEGGNTWALDYVDAMPITDDELVLAMTSSQNKIICLTTTHWYSFNVVAVIWRNKRVNSAEYENPAVFPFTESVLPCNGGVML